MKSGCSKCGDIILADTEDWEKPLCHNHYLEVACDIPKLKSELNQAVYDRDLAKRDRNKAAGKFERLLDAIRYKCIDMSCLKPKFCRKCLDWRDI